MAEQGVMGGNVIDGAVREALKTSVCKLGEKPEAFYFQEGHPDIKRFQGHGLRWVGGPSLKHDIILGELWGNGIIPRNGGGPIKLEMDDIIIHTKEYCEMGIGRKADRFG